jgi:AcrR family transcriptional regulator
VPADPAPSVPGRAPAASAARRAPSQRWLDLGDQQRAAVATAIVELIAGGTTTLRVADIADRAAISRPTFYKYFPTLGTAVIHTARTVLGDLEAFIAAHQTDQENAREQLLERISLSFAYSRAHPEITRFFSYFDFTYSRSAQSLAERAEGARLAETAGDPFHALFLAGQADGSIDPALPADVTYLAFVTSVTGTSQRLLIETDWTDGVDEMARGVHETLITVWRDALQPER